VIIQGVIILPSKRYFDGDNTKQLLLMPVQNILTLAVRPRFRLVPPAIDRDPAKIVEFPRQFSRRLREQKARSRSAVGDLRAAAALQTPIEEIVFSVLALAAIAGVTLLLF
jgi:hypothetical protein